MSEIINNRETQQGLPEEKKQLLEEIIIDLHKGKPLADVKKRFEEAFGSVNAEEIAQLTVDERDHLFHVQIDGGELFPAGDMKTVCLSVVHDVPPKR